MAEPGIGKLMRRVDAIPTEGQDPDTANCGKRRSKFRNSDCPEFATKPDVTIPTPARPTA